MTQDSGRQLYPIERLREKPGPDPALALILEFVPGLFVQTFGIGNIYVGKIFQGVTLMVSYWAVVLLCLFGIGIPTGLVVAGCAWMVFMGISGKLAFSAVADRRDEHHSGRCACDDGACGQSGGAG